MTDIPDLVTATVEVVPDLIAPDPANLRWVASVVFDGVPSSLDCGHLHHTEAAAARCVRAVTVTRDHLADVVRSGAGTCAPVDMPDGRTVYEVTMPHRWADGREATATRRFSLLEVPA